MNYTLHAKWLLEKYGFYDGDMFVSYLEQVGHPCDMHDLLIAIIKEHLLPKIPFPVETQEFVTVHNPIRLTKFDGQEINDDNWNTIHDLLKDISVNVSIEAVRKKIDEL